MMVPSKLQARTLARGLGWLSIGLGAMELLAGRPLARSVGLGSYRSSWVRAYGLREVVSGVGLLNSRDPAAWLWLRVAGDMLDIATLAPNVQGRHTRGARMALMAVAGVTALDVLCARRLSVPAPAAQADYRRRSGWPLPADEMRGAARVDFKPPRDMSTPPSLRPWAGAPPLG